jgi:hypothetical protein
MTEECSYMKTYYEKNREKILTQQKQKYEKKKQEYREIYASTYYICECGKQTSSLRKDLHELTKYHISRINIPDA